MFQGNLPFTFWGECVLGAIYLINLTLLSLLQNKTSFKFLLGIVPDLDVLHVLGCLCFAQNQRAKEDKFAPQSQKCVFIEYPYDKKGWKLDNLVIEKIFVSLDVRFYENKFLYMLNLVIMELLIEIW